MRVVSDCQSRLSVSVSMDMDAWCKHMNMNMNMNRHELLRRVASVWLHGYWHHAARLELHRPSYPVPTLKCWRRTSGGSSGARSRSRRSGCNRQRQQVCHHRRLSAIVPSGQVIPAHSSFGSGVGSGESGSGVGVGVGSVSGSGSGEGVGVGSVSGSGSGEGVGVTPGPPNAPHDTKQQRRVSQLSTWRLHPPTPAGLPSVPSGHGVPAHA